MFQNLLGEFVLNVALVNSWKDELCYADCSPWCVFFPDYVCACVFLTSAAIVSSEQNPVIIIAVVAVAGTIILVFMVFGFIIGRRYALAGPIDSPLL